MGRILTDEDLEAIKQILVPVVIECIDQLAQATAAGFEDIQQQIYTLQSGLEYTNDKLDTIERVQRAEVQRADRHDLIFRKMSQALKTI